LLGQALRILRFKFSFCANVPSQYFRTIAGLTFVSRIFMQATGLHFQGTYLLGRTALRRKSMTPLTKETTEAASSTTQSAAPRAVAPAHSSTHLRSDAVSLEIPVKVHGSRITDVVRGTTPHTEPFEEQTTTMIIFAQGGVVKMTTPVTNGQMMVLTNLKTRQDVICRVLKVRNNPNLQAYVEIEFTHPQPGYWGVFFPTDGPEFAPRTASPGQSSHLDPEAKEKPSMPARPPVTPVVTMAPQNAASKTPAGSYTAPPAKPESAFISIGSQEEVQVSAASTLTAKKAPALEIVKDNRAANAPVNVPKKTPVVDFAQAPVESVAPVSAGLSIAELQGDAQSASMISASVAATETEEESQAAVSAESAAASSRSTFGTFGSSPAAASSREMFGASLGVPTATASPSGTESGKNWILIAACAAVAAVVAAGGTMYFYRTPAGGAATNSAAVTTSAPATPSAPTLVQNPPAQGSQAAQNVYVAPATPANSDVSPSTANTRANNTKPSKAVVTDHTETNAAANSMVGTLNARPVVSQRGRTNQTEAPTLDAAMTAPNIGSALPGMPGSANALPPPPSAPVRVGGELKEPKLISTIAPVYPIAARQASIDGDVVIHAVIDKNGSVAKADVISGPAMLRQAALTAVLRWKYAPSVLDGQPVSVEITVTVKFRR
jgi:TonB family protein